jgi:hypothetical protein
MEAVLWVFTQVSQSIHAPKDLKGKGSAQNGKEVAIVEECLENVEVFSGNLSAIDFIEEHEEDKGDEDILFMLFELCVLRHKRKRASLTFTWVNRVFV